MTLGPGADPDLYVLQLPIAAGQRLISLIAFLGGFSAATAMVIVASVALAIMLSNDIVNPIFLRRRMMSGEGRRHDFYALLLNVRRASILGVMLLTWHNLTYYQDLMRGLREAIAAGTLGAFAADFAAARGHTA